MMPLQKSECTTFKYIFVALKYISIEIYLFGKIDYFVWTGTKYILVLILSSPFYFSKFLRGDLFSHVHPSIHQASQKPSRPFKNRIGPSVTRFGEISLLRQNFKDWQFVIGSIFIWQNFEPNLANL